MYQGFVGHYSHARALAWGEDRMYSIGDLNGIFEWEFHGDCEIDLSKGGMFEPIPEKHRVGHEGLMTKEDMTLPPGMMRTTALGEEQEEMPFPAPTMYDHTLAVKLAEDNLQTHGLGAGTGDLEDFKDDLYRYYSKKGHLKTLDPIT